MLVGAGADAHRPSCFPSPPLGRARGQLREGFRYVRGRADLVLTMVLVFVIGTFGLNFQITTALLAKQVFHRTAVGLRPAVDRARGRGVRRRGARHPARRGGRRSCS